MFLGYPKINHLVAVSAQRLEDVEEVVVGVVVVA
jgi:hypothetical protein